MASRVFPLLQLTDSARDNVLRYFEIYQLLDISLISKRMKPIVKSLNLPTHCFTLILAVTPRLVYQTPPTGAARDWIIQQLNGNGFFESTVHLQSVAHLRSYKTQWRKKGYLLKDYVEHFLDVLNKNRLDNVTFQLEENQIDLDVLRRCLPRTANINVTKNYSVEHLNRILTKFPEVGKLEYSVTKPLEKKLPKVFIQNFDVLSSGHLRFTWDISLDELLEINSAQIEIHLDSVSPKMLNRFLKMWIKGASPRLKYLEFVFRRGPSQEAILKGIKHRVVEQERQFETFYPDRDTARLITVAGGVDVRKANGVVGTIMFEDYDEDVVMSFYVWK